MVFIVIMGSPTQNPLREQFSKICVKSSLYQQIGFYYPSCLISAKIPSYLLVWKNNTEGQKSHGSWVKGK